MNVWLLDTGPLVAYLNAKDRFHSEVAGRLDAFSGLLHTTSAVVTEAMHFVSASPDGPKVLAAFVAASGMEVHDFTQRDELQDAAELMARYADIPMDFADATLVLLAERLKVAEILTLDRRGFTIFRLGRNTPFQLVL